MYTLDIRFHDGTSTDFTDCDYEIEETLLTVLVDENTHYYFPVTSIRWFKAIWVEEDDEVCH